MDRTVKGQLFSMQSYTDSAKQVLQGYKGGIYKLLANTKHCYKEA